MTMASNVLPMSVQVLTAGRTAVMAERTESTGGDEETIAPEARCESEEFPRVDIAMDEGKKGRMELNEGKGRAVGRSNI